MGEVDDDVVRRTLLRLMADPGAAVDGRFFGAVERIRRRLDEALLGATVSVAMLDHWEGMTGEYGRQYMTVPPMRLLCDVLLDLGDVRRMCEQRQPLEFVERLCRLAARLAGLAGMTMIDAGDHRLARSFFSTARTAADETGDRHLRAWVAVRESLVPLYYGDPAQAAAAARAAADLAGHQPCVAGVMAPVVEARALARLARARSGANTRGDTGGRGGAGGAEVRRASAALDRAHEALDQLPEEERRDTVYGYTERQLLFHQGDALVTLGDNRGADDAFGQALRLYSSAEVPRPRAGHAGPGLVPAAGRRARGGAAGEPGHPARPAQPASPRHRAALGPVAGRGGGGQARRLPGRAGLPRGADQRLSPRPQAGGRFTDPGRSGRRGRPACPRTA